MTHPLIARLTDELGWPFLATLPDVQSFVETPGTHCLFVPGDPVRNLETADVAVILPELVQAFQGRFDCAVTGPEIEEAIRESTRVFKTPSLIFHRDGQLLAGIPKVREWSEYLARISQILAMPTPSPSPTVPEAV